MIDGLQLRRTRSEFHAYVSRISGAGVAALALGLGEGLPFIRPPTGLVSACNEAGMPLLTVPSTTPFSTLSEAVFSRLTQERFGGAPLLVSGQQALTRAAARPASAAQVLEALERLAHLRLALLDAAGLEVSAGDPSVAHDSVRQAIAQALPRGLMSNLLVPGVNGFTRIQPVGADGVRGWFAYHAASPTMSEYQSSMVDFAIRLLSIDLERQHAVRAAQRQPRADAAKRLVGERLSPTAAVQTLLAIGVQAEQLVVAVASHPVHNVDDLVDRLADRLLNGLVAVSREHALVVAPAADGLAGELAQAVPQGTAVGLGGAVRPHQCTVSLRQAQTALRSAVARGGGVVDATALTSARAVLEAVPADLLGAYSDHVLSPLSRAGGHDDLLRTLKAWLDACGVADSASAALGIHRHTLRHRLERIETLTGRRLSNAHDRYGLWLAFEAREVAAAME
jgi:purine catabolism regulator